TADVFPRGAQHAHYRRFRTRGPRVNRLTPTIVMNKEFTGKTALVTGGSRGIGRAISLKLAQHGANIAINYQNRDADALATKQAVEKEGVRCVLVKGDIS